MRRGLGGEEDWVVEGWELMVGGRGGVFVAGKGGGIWIWRLFGRIDLAFLPSFVRVRSVGLILTDGREWMGRRPLLGFLFARGGIG